MNRLFGRYGFRAGFMLRRIDRAAGCVNAFLLAAALGLGMLDTRSSGSLPYCPGNETC
jgi:hypothetical protein